MTEEKSRLKTVTKNNFPMQSITKVNFSRGLSGGKRVVSFRVDSVLWGKFKERVKSKGQDICFVLYGLISGYLEADDVGSSQKVLLAQSQNQAIKIDLHLHNHYVVDRPRRRKPITDVMASYEGQLCQKCHLRPAMYLDVLNDEDETTLLLCKICHMDFLKSRLRRSTQLEVYFSNTLNVQKTNVQVSSAGAGEGSWRLKEKVEKGGKVS